MSDAELPAQVVKRRKGPTGKRLWLFRLFVLIALLPLIELISWMGLRLDDQEFSLARIRRAQAQLAETATPPEARAEVVHPYMGWIINPQTNPEVDIEGRNVPVNAMGFVDDGPTLRKRAPGHFVLGIIGGSVAQHLGVRGADAMKRRLSQSARFQGVTVDLVRLSFAGFKQPQQLMTLNYVLALGGELDAVVNIDGFNEVTLPVCENREVDVFAAYPRLWNTLTINMTDPRNSEETFRLLELRAQRQSAARAAAESPFRFSGTRNLLWKIRDAYLSRQLALVGRDIFEKQKIQGRKFATTGPPQLYQGGDESMYHQLIEIWSNCSRQMDRICRANHITYIQILQPNQYLPNSKPIGKDEKAIAIRDDACYGRCVKTAFPLLIREGAKLKADGIDFHDLTQLFAAFADPIYIDNCCHYNQKGNDLLAEAVAEALLSALDQTGSKSAESRTK